MTTASDLPDDFTRDVAQAFTDDFAEGVEGDGGACSPAPAGAARPVVAHHLFIGFSVAAPWMLLVPAAARAGVAPVVVLLVVVAVVLPPVAFVVLRRRLAVEGLTGSTSEFVPAVLMSDPVCARLGLRRPSRHEVLLFGLPAAAVAVVLPGSGLPVEAALGRWGWFSLWPSTGVSDLSSGAAGSASASGLSWAVLGLWVAVAVVVGPVLEEVLFRGLLQPLVPGGAWGRVLGGSALFAVYHLWQPGSWVTVWLATLPVAWVRERTGSTWLAAGAHVLVNAVALVMLLVGAMTR